MRQFLLLLGSLILLNSAQLVAMLEVGKKTALEEHKDMVRNNAKGSALLALYTEIWNKNEYFTKSNTDSPCHLGESKLFLSKKSITALFNFFDSLSRSSVSITKNEIQSLVYREDKIVFTENTKQGTLLLKFINTAKINNFKSDIYLKIISDHSDELFIANSNGETLDLKKLDQATNKTAIWDNFLGKKYPYFWSTTAAISLFAAGIYGLFAWRNKEAIKGFSYSTVLSRFFGLFTKKRAAV